MVRYSRTARCSATGSPHACGDGPRCRHSGCKALSFSPRVWGWSSTANPPACWRSVLPTRVGMVRRSMPSRSGCGSSPHACGDGPPREAVVTYVEWFSPRVWGWSVHLVDNRRQHDVLPTRVGMVLAPYAAPYATWRSPHACGDGPRRACLSPRRLTFSPRVWGWSGAVGIVPSGESVLPTRVGMVRSIGRLPGRERRSPHACGDGPACSVVA